METKLCFFQQQQYSRKLMHNYAHLWKKILPLSPLSFLLRSPNRFPCAKVSFSGGKWSSGFGRVIPRLHDEANMKNTYSKYTCTTRALSLLHVCFIV